MKKVLGRLVLMVLCVVLGAGGLFVYQQYFSKGVNGSNSQSTTIDLTVLKEKLEQNNELSTSKYLYTDSVAITDQNDLSRLGLSEIKLPGTTAIYVLQFDETIKAGFKLDNVTPELKDENTVLIKLPAPEVLSHETGEVEVIDEKQNICNPLKPGEETSWIEDQKQSMVERAKENGLFDDAKENAKITFQSLYSSCLPDGTSIEIEFEEE